MLQKTLEFKSADQCGQAASNPLSEGKTTPLSLPEHGHSFSPALTHWDSRLLGLTTQPWSEASSLNPPPWYSGLWIHTKTPLALPRFPSFQTACHGTSWPPWSREPICQINLLLHRYIRVIPFFWKNPTHHLTDSIMHFYCWVSPTEYKLQDSRHFLSYFVHCLIFSIHKRERTRGTHFIIFAEW